jgi:putative ABC transport system permease protein
VVEALQSLLSFPRDSPGPVSWVTPASLVKRIDRLKTTIGWTAAVLTLLCLALGGTTLGTLMIANVRERVAEIGLRRTLGATRREIASLFVVEALTSSAAGALLGCILAQAALLLLAPLFPIRLALGWSGWIVPVATCALCSLAFSWGPSLRAAAIPPARALRAE